MVATLADWWELETRLKALPQAAGPSPTPVRCAERSAHRSCLVPQHSRAHHTTGTLLHPPALPGITVRNSKSLPKQARFLTPAVVCAEKQLPRPAGWQSSTRVPLPMCPREVPVPGQEPLSPANIYTVFPVPRSKEAALGLGEKKNRKRLEARKQNTGTGKPGAVVRTDFCLLETVSRKCHSSFVLIRSGFCLTPTSQFGTLPSSVPLVCSVMCLGNLIVSCSTF